MSQSQSSHSKINSETILPPDHVTASARVASMAEYRKNYHESISDPVAFWSRTANTELSWFLPFDKVYEGCFEDGNIAWFCNGKLNVSYNCIDRHLQKKADQVALLWESDSGDEVHKITYRELHAHVCRLANLLQQEGIRKGDTVTIYMPMVPEAVYAMLACTRIGAIHSVVFAGFSADSLQKRIVAAQSRVLITANEGLRMGKVLPLKKTCDNALTGLDFVRRVLVLKRTNTEVSFDPLRDRWLHEEMLSQRPYCPPMFIDSEDPMFILYTSGSTGEPKGLLHTTAGYLLYASLTFGLIFDYQQDHIHACVADVGWITGHSYIVYGPLTHGATTFLFEGHPLYPHPGRYWEMVERHRFTSFYTAPTAIRTLMRYGNENVTKYDRSSLRILGTVGEPIDPQSWKWYYEVVGEKKCSVVDTYWQSETGGIIVSSLPGATPMKPGSATLPF